MQVGSASSGTSTEAFVASLRHTMDEQADANITEILEAALHRGSAAIKAAEREGEKGLEAVRETLADVHKAQDSLQAEHSRMTRLVVEIGSLLAQTSGVPGGSPRPVLPFLPAAAMAAHGGCWGRAPFTCNGDNSTTATPTSRCSTLSSASGFLSPCGNGTDAAPEATLAGHAPPPPPAVHDFVAAWQQGGSALLGGGAAAQTSKFVGHSSKPLLQQPPRPVLSLASELGIVSPRQSTTASATPSSPTSIASSWEGSTDPKEVDAYVFTLTLRVAEGTQLGICANRHAGYLCLDRVLPGGAIEAWNRQCGSSGAAEKVLQPGDRIVFVNDVAGNPEAMLAECNSKRLVRLCVVRNGP